MAEKLKFDSGCKERVAMEIANHIGDREEMYKEKENFRKMYLDLYAEVLDAVEGRRDY